MSYLCPHILAVLIVIKMVALDRPGCLIYYLTNKKVFGPSVYV